jgi:effector-binding domain-containing protein
MIDRPHITRAEVQQAAVIHITVPRDQIKQVMDAGFVELFAAVAEQGLTPVGPPFAHHLKMDPTMFDFELGVPVAGPVTAVGRVAPGGLPTATVARTVFHGNYDGLGAAWGEFGNWIAAEGHTPAPDLWEVYTTGPETSPDPADWRTELNRPLIV